MSTEEQREMSVWEKLFVFILALLSALIGFLLLILFGLTLPLWGLLLAALGVLLGALAIAYWLFYRGWLWPWEREFWAYYWDLIGTILRMLVVTGKTAATGPPEIPQGVKPGGVTITPTHVEVEPGGPYYGPYVEHDGKTKPVRYK